MQLQRFTVGFVLRLHAKSDHPLLGTFGFFHLWADLLSEKLTAVKGSPFLPFWGHLLLSIYLSHDTKMKVRRPSAWANLIIFSLKHFIECNANELNLKSAICKLCQLIFDTKHNRYSASCKFLARLRLKFAGFTLLYGAVM